MLRKMIFSVVLLVAGTQAALAASYKGSNSGNVTKPMGCVADYNSVNDCSGTIDNHNFGYIDYFGALVPFGWQQSATGGRVCQPGECCNSTNYYYLNSGAACDTICKQLNYTSGSFDTSGNTICFGQYPGFDVKCACSGGSNYIDHIVTSGVSGNTNQCLAVSVQMQDSGNGAVTSAYDVTLWLGHARTTGSFYSNNTCTNVIYDTTITSGNSSKTIYWKDSATGTYPIQAVFIGADFVEGTATIN